jgi:hypothetical protein
MVKPPFIKHLEGNVAIEKGMWSVLSTAIEGELV